MFERSDDALDIELLAVSDATLITVASVIEPLRAANRVAARDLYRWRVATPDGAPAITTSGVPIPSQGRFEPALSRAPLFVVASYNERDRASRDLLRRLRAAGRGGRVVCGVESGGWLMARAGLLEGRRATVHWEDLEEFAASFPDIEARPERYVVDGPRVTCGGAAPALDLMLRLIATRQGEALAHSVAGLFVDGESASAGGGAFRAAPLRDPRLAAAMRVMHENISEPLAMAEVAARAGLGARRMQSLFVELLGLAPHAYYLGLRLDAARRMLRETRRPAFEIAERCGFASPGAFARAYRNRFDESATAIRRRRAG